MEFFEQVKRTFEQMDGRLNRMEGDVDSLKQAVAALQQGVAGLQQGLAGLRDDLQTVGGAFASIEAHMVAAAAREKARDEQMADVVRRVEALERRAS